MKFGVDIDISGDEAPREALNIAVAVEALARVAQNHGGADWFTKTITRNGFVVSVDWEIIYD